MTENANASPSTSLSSSSSPSQSEPASSSFIESPETRPLTDHSATTTTTATPPPPQQLPPTTPLLNPSPESVPDAEPPPYEEAPSLRRATVMQSRRYDQNGAITMVHRVIPPGTFAYRDHSEERVLPPEWLQFIHPEGKVYFYHPRLRIVTEAWIYTYSILQRVIHWANEFFQLAQQHSVVLPVTSELCLELDPESHDCTYYLVDHARRTEFWIETTTTDLLDLPPVTSHTHLRLTLEHHYWTHVEYYPVHLQLSEEVESELQGILLHACADAMTSDLSTAPMSPDKSQAYLDLLHNVQTSPVSRGYKNCIIARLWGEFARNRSINLHGEENARMCRDQMLAEDPEKETSIILTFANSLLFNVPESHLRGLKSLYVDDIVYTEHWQRFIRQLIQEWQESVLGSMVLLITELILFMNLARQEANDTNIWVSIQHAISLVAIILAVGSTLIGVTLIRYHKRLADIHAAEAVSTVSIA